MRFLFQQNFFNLFPEKNPSAGSGIGIGNKRVHTVFILCKFIDFKMIRTIRSDK